MSSTINLSDEETATLFDIICVHRDMGDDREETKAIHEKIRRQL